MCCAIFDKYLLLHEFFAYVVRVHRLLGQPFFNKCTYMLRDLWYDWIALYFTWIFLKRLLNFSFSVGCTVDINWVNLSSYLDLNINTKLAEIYKSHATGQGVKFVSREEEDKMPQGSTDMGNVSHIVPSIQPFYSIDTLAPNHSVDFATAAATEIAHDKTIIAAKSLAMTAIDVLSDPATLETVRKQFSQSL